MRQVAFLFAVAAFVSVLIGVAAVYLWRARRASRNGWSILLRRLKQIDRDKFAAVALDLLEEGDAQLALLVRGQPRIVNRDDLQIDIGLRG